jgi:hypothetical protein
MTDQPAALDAFAGFEQDDYRLRAVESWHETAKGIAIAKIQAWASVWKVAIAAVLVTGVLAYAMTLGVPVPWDQVLSLLVKATGH